MVNVKLVMSVMNMGFYHLDLFITTHDAFDTANSYSMQDACQINV